MKLTKSEYYINVCKLLVISSVLVAIANGFFIAVFHLNIPFGPVVRILIIAYAILYFLTTKFTLKTYLILLFFIWLLLIPLWVITNNEFLLSREIEQYLKLLFPFLIAVILKRYRSYIGAEAYKFLLPFSFIASLSILFSFITGINVEASRPYEFGINSFFIARNEISLSLVSILPFVAYEYIITRKKFYLLGILLSIVSLVLLGSKSAFIGVSITFISLLFVFFFFSKKQIAWRLSSRLLIIILSSILFIIVGITSITIIKSYPHMVQDFSDTISKHPRKLLITIANNHFHERGIINWIGEGFYNFGLAIERGHNWKMTSNVGKLTENDLYDLWGAFGYVYGSMWLAIPVIVWLINFYKTFRKFSVFTFLSLVSLTIILFHSFLVGHALMSPLVASVLAVHYYYFIK